MKLIKRIACIVLCSVLVFLILPSRAAAAELFQDYELVEQYENGYRLLSSSSTTTLSSGSRTREKTSSFVGPSGNVLWAATLTATFTYDGTTSTCVDSYVDVVINDSGWSCASSSASRSGDTAYATVTMEKKFLFIVIDQKTIQMSITCDANGNIS